MRIAIILLLVGGCARLTVEQMAVNQVREYAALQLACEPAALDIAPTGERNEYRARGCGKAGRYVCDVGKLGPGRCKVGRVGDVELIE